MQVEENTVKRVPREELAKEMIRVSGNVLDSLMLPLSESNTAGVTCDFSGSIAYNRFKQKYKGNIRLVEETSELTKVEKTLETERKFMNELSPEPGKYPLVFRAQSDSLLYISKTAPGKSCGHNPATDVWLVSVPKQEIIKSLTLKVKPKPKKGPNW